MTLDIHENQDSNIIKIQKNLIMMDFDIEMINKVIFYFNITSEDQAIDYLTKDSEGFWRHPFIEKINDNNNNNNDLGKLEEENKEKSGLIKGMTSKIKEFKDKGLSNIVYSSLTTESNLGSGDSTDHISICEICGEPESFHLNLNINLQVDNNFLEERKMKELIEDANIRLEYNNNENNDININNINNENIIDNYNNECPICLGEVTDPVEIETCHHRYCRECFVEYLLNLIKTKNIEKIPCPTKNCFEKELKEEFFSNYLTEEEYFKYRTIRSQIDIMKDSKKMFCPFCDSYALLPDEHFILDPNDTRYIKTTMTCVNGHKFCSCGIALHEGDCYRDSNDFQKFLINENVKQCPKCGFYIKKMRGCNHMTCGNSACKFEFCWLCMQEAVPGHFQFGNCKGMQFIDTTSCAYKLKIRHPFIFKIYNLITSILIYAIFLSIPSLLFIIVFLAIFAEIQTNKLKNGFQEFLYCLSVVMILFSLNNIGHCICAFFILIFLLGCFCRLVLCVLKLIRKFRNISVENQAQNIN